MPTNDITIKNPAPAGTTAAAVPNYNKPPPIKPIKTGTPGPGSGYSSQGLWNPQEDSVAGQVDKVLDRNSNLMRTARRKGEQFANRRGLQNSSIAAQAGEQAVIENALPIATQDAAQLHQKNLAAQDYRQQGGLIQTEGEQTRANIQAAGYQDRAGAWQKFGFDKVLLNTDNRTKKDIAELNASTNAMIADMNISQDAKETATAAIVQMTNQYATLYAQIAGNPNIPAETRDAYLNSILFNRDSTINLVEQLSGIDLKWRAPPVSTRPEDWRPQGGDRGFGVPGAIKPPDTTTGP